MRIRLLHIPNRWIVSLQVRAACGYAICRKVASDNVQYLVKCGAFYISAVRRT